MVWFGKIFGKNSKPDSSNPKSIEDPDSACAVCSHVAKEGYPILRAQKSAPVYPEDSGWQLLCNTGKKETKPIFWSLSHMIQVEPSLIEFLKKPAGFILVREGIEKPWRVIVGGSGIIENN
jgi:hypothetical protein